MVRPAPVKHCSKEHNITLEYPQGGHTRNSIIPLGLPWCTELNVEQLYWNLLQTLSGKCCALGEFLTKLWSAMQVHSARVVLVIHIDHNLIRNSPSAQHFPLWICKVNANSSTLVVQLQVLLPSHWMSLFASTLFAKMQWHETWALIGSSSKAVVCNQPRSQASYK